MAEKVPLLLLPGLLCDAALWQPQVEGLADIVEPVIPDLTQDSSIADMARRAIEAAPARFAMAGLSMGGYVAMEVMRQAPERVLRLALLDTSARSDTPNKTAQRHDFIALSKRGEFHGVTRRLLPLLVHPDRVEEKALADIIIGMSARVGVDGFLRQQEAAMGRIDSRASLADAACPTLVLCGRDDALTPPPLSNEMASLIRGARLELIDRCGHVSTLKRPAAVTAAMRRWLA